MIFVRRGKLSANLTVFSLDILYLGLSFTFRALDLVVIVIGSNLPLSYFVISKCDVALRNQIHKDSIVDPKIYTKYFVVIESKR